jgi:methionyl aminopeptidase
MDAQTLDAYRKAGKIAHAALQHGISLIRPGSSMRGVLDGVEAFIRAQGAEPAFPAQSCVNHIAAHYCPTDAEDYVYVATDLVKLDVGVHVDGYIADNATTVSLDGQNERLVLAVKEALAAAEGVLRAGVTPHEIGEAVHAAIERRGLQPVRNLTGHGLARFTVHTNPSIPNYPSGERTPLQEGQIVAIEPFATTGAGLIYSAPGPTVFSVIAIKPMRTPHAKATLDFLFRYHGLPFTARWVTRALGPKGALGLSELRRAGVLAEYPPLPEKTGGLVAQHENTYLVTKDGFIKTTE